MTPAGHRWLERLRAFRADAVREELRARGVEEEIPQRFLPYFANFVSAAEHVHLLSALIGPPPKRVLVVGTFGGRDFWGLRARGYDVTGMNLTADPDCPPTVVADAEQEWPFPAASFDVIVAGEILEHLFEDRAALLHARRVLTPDGALLVTVPFVHDAPDYHVRVHTRLSIVRLLENAGFSVERVVERPGFPLKRALTVAINAGNLARRALGGATHFDDAARAIGELELRLGERPSAVRKTLGLFGLVDHGCMLLARRSDRAPEYKSINEREFGGG